ncbi:MAG: IS21 family transposase [Streptococcaceae bacterium]|nr:IS21 family transposase [Streptococcaceae bacterium]
MARGGKRDGAGRKRQGITKKVSLTLTEDLWHEIDAFDGTVADYIRSLKNVNEGKDNPSEMNKVTNIKSHQVTGELTTDYAKSLGEIMEVDWAEKTAHLIDDITGEIIKVYIFVAALPASRYAYVEAFMNMSQDSWISAHVNAYQYFDGVARLTIPLNLETDVTKSSKSKPIINKTYQEMADHYGTVILSDQVKSSKASVESEVDMISTWIIAALRESHHFTLKKLNKEIKKKLVEYNKNPFQSRAGSRHSVYLNEEKPLLMPLPTSDFAVANWKVATVQFNYHVSVEKMNYSVPSKYIKHKVDVRITRTTVEIFYKQTRIASHPRLTGFSGQYSTTLDHMPDGHRAYAQLSAKSLLRRASFIGEFTESVIDFLLKSAKIEQQAYKSCLGILKLSDKYGGERLESACRISWSLTKRPSYKSINMILKNGSDRMSPLPLHETKQESDEFSSDYYGGDD